MAARLFYWKKEAVKGRLPAPELRNRLHQAVSAEYLEHSGFYREISGKGTDSRKLFVEMASNLDCEGLLRFLENRGINSSGTEQ